MSTVDLGGVLVGDGQPAYVCAEIGLNHNGSVLNAEKLIDAAASAGCQAVKLQKRTLDVCFTPEQMAAPRESPWGSTVGEYKRAVELDRQAYVDLARYARGKGLAFTASCWDERALADVVSWVDPPWIKIASASVTDHDLLRAYARTGQPLVMSTGMSTMDEVRAAWMTIQDTQIRLIGRPALVLLACTSTYPCEEHEINLRQIETLRAAFPCTPIGYSGHERGIATTVAAATLGACFVERHITLDRTMWGTDHAASLEPPGLARMVRDIRTVERAMGDGVKTRLASEEPIRAKLRRVG